MRYSRLSQRSRICEGHVGETYPDKRPRRTPMIMRQMPDEITHDASDHQTGNELRGANAMEDHARVARGCSLCTAIEGVELHRRGCVG